VAAAISVDQHGKPWAMSPDKRAWQATAK
jgi:hypothetical protein